MTEIVIINMRNPHKAELYKLILELANSQGLSFEYVKKQVEIFERSRPTMLNLADEFKKAGEELKNITFQLEKIAEDFPPSHINPAHRQYQKRKRK